MKSIQELLMKLASIENEVNDNNVSVEFFSDGSGRLRIKRETTDFDTITELEKLLRRS